MREHHVTTAATKEGGETTAKRGDARTTPSKDTKEHRLAIATKGDHGTIATSEAGEMKLANHHSGIIAWNAAAAVIRRRMTVAPHPAETSTGTTAIAMIIGTTAAVTTNGVNAATRTHSALHAARARGPALYPAPRRRRRASAEAATAPPRSATTTVRGRGLAVRRHLHARSLGFLRAIRHGACRR